MSSDDNMNKREVNITALITFLFIITLVIGLSYNNNITGRDFLPPSEGEGQPPSTVACSSNSQCNDNNACTNNICNNAGTTSSYCSYPPIANCCGNGNCEPVAGEGCSTCSSDCKCATGYTCQSNVCTQQESTCTGGIPYGGCKISTKEYCDNGVLKFNCNKCGYTCATGYSCQTDGTCKSNCGNNMINSGEQCDGTNLNSKTCQNLGQGFTDGTLTCKTDCTFDTSQCTTIPPSTCGNGVVDSGEECDGVNLNSKTCTSLGYSGGTLSCITDCTFYESQCISPSEPTDTITFCSTATDYSKCETGTKKYCTRDESNNLVLVYDCRQCGYSCPSGTSCSSEADSDGGCYTCTDTDNSGTSPSDSSHLVKGSISGNKKDDTGTEPYGADSKDYCQDSSTLIEYLCINNVPYIDEVTCSSGCGNGVCLTASVSEGEGQDQGPPVDTGPPSAFTPSIKQCNDNLDNDNDGFIDLDDPGCINVDDNDEVDEEIIEAVTQCSDGIDNDNDGLIDLEDSDCLGPEDDDETSEILVRECEDSDQGKNYFIEGTILKNEVSFKDYCSDSTTLKEGYCNEYDEIAVETITCPDNQQCRKGICKEQTIALIPDFTKIIRLLLSLLF